MANEPVSKTLPILSIVLIVIALVMPKVPGLMMESSVKENVVCAEIVDETMLPTLIVLVVGVVVQVGVEFEVIPKRENKHF